ncbi:serine/threonine-protein phosphatase 7 long form-like protein [Cucumis melo var. makuwa]|uniref:Serine/threonine-protein phosphatase 7 long form-like protein n=2 Tax=Cucumis melo TaxID=3656 RepID=A0A5A7UER8_CUCMM|nr:serine/threonine-protein phosphatase 7 long form-like protein [Cucumis melo var. makuwa]TYK12329.1 serine/threonine-protein phosphatase 7 long form-like protein [Cucumis melo var. makuwa]
MDMSMISLYNGQHTQVVILMEGTYSCNKWQSFKIPCSHIIDHIGYLIHRHFELSKEKGSVSTHDPLDQRIAPYLEAAGLGFPSWIRAVRLSFDYYTGRALETGDPHISHALWGVHDHTIGCCNDYLGVLSPDMKGQRLSLPWMAELFQELPPDADVVSVQRYARVHILQLIDNFLFTDKSNTLGTLSSESCIVPRDCWPTNAAISMDIRQISYCGAIEKLQDSDDRPLSFRRFITTEGDFYHRVYNFVADIRAFSVKHNLEALGDMCDTTMEDLTQIIQQTRQLNVVDTDRRRMRPIRRRQGDDVVEGDEEN